LVGLVAAHPATAEAVELEWRDNYQVAYKEAADQHKMLLILFQAERPDALQTAVEAAFENDARIREQLARFVLVRLPVDTVIHVDGKPVTLLRHPSMAEMHGRAGLAIIDLIHEEKPYYGRVVSAYPFMRGKYYAFRVEYLPTILTLPPGTITQRTMIWAVRVHPEGPASTRGVKNPLLAREAQSHSRYQARIGVQGHQRWNLRFHRIRRLLAALGFRGEPVEVVAESWPNQTMIDSCLDCVRSWRHSSGHWNAVKSYHQAYGYDIQRGPNGIWYGTGIFAN
jgi:hypothetical protein